MKKRVRIVICFILIFAIFIKNEGVVLADQISDLKQKTKEDQKKLDELSEQISDLAGEKEGIVDDMNALEKEIVDIMASISMIEDEIAVKKEEVKEAESNLIQAKADEKEQYETMKLRLKYMYENGNQSYINILITATSMEQILNRADYVEGLYEYDRNLLGKYQEAREQVEILKEELEVQQAELEADEIECEEEKEGMELALAELKQVSADYDRQINKAKQQAEEYKKQIKQRNEQIAKLEAEERRKQEAAKAAAQKVKGTAKVDTASIMAANGSEEGKKIAIYACGFVGNPYVPGGTSLTNGADCSGFTQSVYKAYGYSIPRNSYSQRSAGREVSYSEAQPGDLICYAGHVAMYIGNGMIVHASSVKTGIKIGYATYKPIITVRRIV